MSTNFYKEYLYTNWQTRGANLIDDYSGVNASIGYNKSRDEWIVINKE